MRTLYTKLAVTLGVLVLALSVLIGLIFLRSSRLALSEIHQSLNRNLASQLLKEYSPLTEEPLGDEGLKHIFHTLMVINPSIEVYYLAPDGRILNYSAPEGAVFRMQVEMQPVRDFLLGSSLPIFGDDPRTERGSKVFSAAPIGSKKDPQGYLYVVVGSQEYESVASVIQTSQRLRLGVMTAIGATLFALIAGLLLFRLLTRRLVRLKRQVQEFQKTGFRELPPVASSESELQDEIAALDTSFRTMAKRLVDDLERRDQDDATRRELIANVSHDLRTPLSVLSGYLEVLDLKREALSDQERANFVTQAIRQCSRLNKLIGELFDLSTMEAGTYDLQVEATRLDELVHDTVGQLKSAAKEKGLALSAEVSPVPILVDADIGLMARVLENLLSNSFRHTPPGESIRVRLQAGDPVILEVEDTGPGIPNEQHKKVFDRSFRGEPSEGFGLGLAITQKIVELHRGSITVHNVHPHGVRFEVHLPVDSRSPP